MKKFIYNILSSLLKIPSYGYLIKKYTSIPLKKKKKKKPHNKILRNTT